MRRMCKTFFFCFFVSSSPSVSVYFSFTLPLPPSVVSVSLCLPLSFLSAVFLGLSTARSLDGIHRFSWAARSCDPPAKNQTALPTARLVHKETRMLTHTHTHLKTVPVPQRERLHNKTTTQTQSTGQYVTT